MNHVWLSLFQQVQGDVGGDLLILGIPVAVVISLLVQFCKMLKMPSQWAPWASVAIGFLVASGVQATKENSLTLAVVIYTLLLGASYALMANGIFAMLVGSQDTVRARNAQTLTGTISVPPQPVDVPVSTSSVSPIPAAGTTEVHIVGGPSSPGR